MASVTTIVVEPRPTRAQLRLLFAIAALVVVLVTAAALYVIGG